MNTAVSYVQGRGRARQANSSFVMLDQRHDRPAALLAQQEEEQHRIASTFVPEKGSNPVAAITAQQNRERGCAAVLDGVNDITALAKLNLYCKKTKVLCDEIYTPGPGDCHTFALTLQLGAAHRPGKWNWKYQKGGEEACCRCPSAQPGVT